MVAPIAWRNQHGTPDSPFLLDLRGETIDAQCNACPLRLDNCSYVDVIGGNLCNSNRTVCWVTNSHHINLRQVCAWNAPPAGNHAIFGIHSCRRVSLFDCAGWGTGRKIFSSSQGGNDTVVERCWGRFEASTCNGWKMVFPLVYNCYRNEYRDCIGVCAALPAVPHDFRGIFAVDRLDGPPVANTIVERCLALSAHPAAGFSTTGVLGVNLFDCISRTANDVSGDNVQLVRLIHRWADSPMLDRIKSLAGVDVLADLAKAITTNNPTPQPARAAEER